jgi:sporulation protein YlmC with PRC-barrel domain
MEHYKLSASDGEVGTVANFFLDDEFWAVRYLVVDTGGFFEGRHVLLSPTSFLKVEWGSSQFHVALTMDKVKHSPEVDTDQPVSRQHELAFSQYYGYPHYWGASDVWGMTEDPARSALAAERATPAGLPGPSIDDVHLHSAVELRGYHIEGSDGQIGQVHDFIVDDETWEVRYLVISTSNWWMGKEVLVSPLWASSVSWEDRIVHVDMSRESIKESPEFNASAGINREYESSLYDYYGRPVYWDADSQVPPQQPAPAREVPKPKWVGKDVKP